MQELNLLKFRHPSRWYWYHPIRLLIRLHDKLLVAKHLTKVSTKTIQGTRVDLIVQISAILRSVLPQAAASDPRCGTARNIMAIVTSYRSLR
jgi:hypothetical protein